MGFYISSYTKHRHVPRGGPLSPAYFRRHHVADYILPLWGVCWNANTYSSIHKRNGSGAKTGFPANYVEEKETKTARVFIVRTSTVLGAHKRKRGNCQGIGITSITSSRNLHV